MSLLGMRFGALAVGSVFYCQYVSLTGMWELWAVWVWRSLTLFKFHVSHWLLDYGDIVNTKNDGQFCWLPLAPPPRGQWKALPFVHLLRKLIPLSRPYQCRADAYSGTSPLKKLSIVVKILNSPLANRSPQLMLYIAVTRIYVISLAVLFGSVLCHKLLL